VNNVVNTQIKKWEFAFPVLLYHWRCTLRGYSPFKLARENPSELREKGHIDHEGFQYITKIANLFDRTNPGRCNLFNLCQDPYSDEHRSIPAATYRVCHDSLFNVKRVHCQSFQGSWGIAARRGAWGALSIEVYDHRLKQFYD
jgi:hypothetical protein